MYLLKTMNNRYFGFFGGLPPGFVATIFFVPYISRKALDKFLSI
jgi:hypothetical protein